MEDAVAAAHAVLPIRPWTRVVLPADMERRPVAGRTGTRRAGDRAAPRGHRPLGTSETDIERSGMLRASSGFAITILMTILGSCALDPAVNPRELEAPSDVAERG